MTRLDDKIGHIKDVELRRALWLYNRVANGIATTDEVFELRDDLLSRFNSLDPDTFFHEDDLGRRLASKRRKTFYDVLGMLESSEGNRSSAIIAVDSALGMIHKDARVVEGAYDEPFDMEKENRYTISYRDRLLLTDILDVLQKGEE